MSKQQPPETAGHPNAVPETSFTNARPSEAQPAAATHATAPLLSIGLPVRNGEPYIREMIDSILAQTFTDFELVISDNNSTDGTPAICAEYAALDSRVRFCPLSENIGAAPNHNRTFHLSRGRYFKYTGHDDVMAPQFLERCLEALEHAPDAIVAYPRTMFIDANGDPIREDTISLASPEARPHQRLKPFFKCISFINPLYGVIRSEALAKTRLEGSFLKSDQVLLAELLMLGRFIEIPEVLFYRRLHSGSSMRANPTKAALRRFYDPKSRTHGHMLPVQLRLTLEYLRSCLRMPAALSDRLLSLGVTLIGHTVPTLLKLAQASIGRRRRGVQKLQTAR